MSKCFMTLVCLAALPTYADDFDLSSWRIEEETRFQAPEARQGVAVDDRYLYVIGNQTVGKYDKHSFEPLANWAGPEAGPIIHLNAGVVFEGQLLLAHSNYPDVPMTEYGHPI